MSRIFISHNSADNELALLLSDQLKSAGHRSVYLDFHPEDGIPAGRVWEQDLYRELRTCQAMVILCSRDSMASSWCFAEVTHAKALGKPVFPIRVDDCDLHPILSSQQWIDWRAGRDAAFQRLERGLKEAGLDPVNAFDWDGSRPPYPGMMAFEEADAAVFFGRDEEIQKGLERLNHQRQFGGTGSLVVLGPSGSGKSSFVRAGLLPRMKSNPDQWQVLPPMRPRDNAVRELAVTLAKGLARGDDSPGWHDVQSRLESEPGALNNMLADWQISTGHRDVKFLLVIDQAEELLTAESGTPAFTALLSDALESDDSSLQLLWTLRSDFLDAFQQHPNLGHLEFEDIRIGPMDTAAITRVIEGPAAVAGIKLESGLVPTLLEDMTSNEALPLLAFALRSLNEQFGGDGLLEVEEYRQLGGLSGSVARVAERVFEAARLDKDQVNNLRAAFLGLVRIDDAGHFTRRSLNANAISRDSLPVMEQFVQARLLMTHSDAGERAFEVAHEALFTSWRRLKTWLQESREQLLWLNRLERLAEQWKDSGNDEDSLLRGASLNAAEESAEHPAWQENPLSETAEAYLEASTEARRRQSRFRIMLIGVVALTVVSSAGTLAIFFVGLFPVMAQWYSSFGMELQVATIKLADSGSLLMGAWIVGVIAGMAVYLFRKRLSRRVVSVTGWILGPALSLGILVSMATVLLGLMDMLIGISKVQELIVDVYREPAQLERAIATGDEETARQVARQMLYHAEYVGMNSGSRVVMLTRMAEMELKFGNLEEARKHYDLAEETALNVGGSEENRAIWTAYVERSRRQNE